MVPDCGELNARHDHHCMYDESECELLVFGYIEDMGRNIQLFIPSELRSMCHIYVTGKTSVSYCCLCRLEYCKYTASLSLLSIEILIKSKKLLIDSLSTLQWVKICRKLLRDIEATNIHKRAKSLTELINQKMEDINSRLDLSDTKLTPFLFTVNDIAMKKYLKFIRSWKGLILKTMPKTPKTYIEYENKAKNWLYGRRAKKYTENLLPDMIEAADNHADFVTRQIFANNPKFSKVYKEICMVGFLSALCSARILLNDSTRKINFIPNMHRKSKLSEISQRYASDRPNQYKFSDHYLRGPYNLFEVLHDHYLCGFVIASVIADVT